MYDEALWDEWCSNEGRNYLEAKGKRRYIKKGYTHFDHRFWFPERTEELRKILQSNLRVYKKSLKRTEYWSFAPFVRVLVKMPRFKYQELEGHYDLETKVRPICFSSHLDSLILGYYAYALTKVYERYIKVNHFEDCVLAYRSDLGFSNIQFAKEVFAHIKRMGSCTAIALDIKGYFDNIDHEILKSNWAKMFGDQMLDDLNYKLYKTLTQYTYVNKASLLKKFRPEKKRSQREPITLLDLVPAAKDFQKFDLLRKERLLKSNKTAGKNGRLKGVPQGAAMSAVLSNIYLLDFDKLMSEKSDAEGFLYRRYCDDILIICDTKRSSELKQFCIQSLSTEYFLEVQKKKVETIDFRNNSKGEFRAFKRHISSSESPVQTDATNEKRFYKALQYLGFEYNGKNILIRTSSLSRYFRKMRARIVKTISMAYGSGVKSNKIHKKQIFERYTHLGNRNFISYAYEASQPIIRGKRGTVKEGMNSPAIRGQLSRHFNILMKELRKKNSQRFTYKTSKGKAIKEKAI